MVSFMKKIKRLFLYFSCKLLKIYRFFGNDFYKKKSYKYYKDCGIDFYNGKPKFMNYDIDIDFLASDKIHIGKNTVIAKGTIILVHDYSIECGLEAINKQNPNYEVQFIKDVYIGENSFIGARCFILPGTTIGKNCIIGAGSVVSGDIPDNSVAAGNPCKIITQTTTWAEKKYLQKEYVSGTKNKRS